MTKDFDGNSQFLAHAHSAFFRHSYPPFTRVTLQGASSYIIASTPKVRLAKGAADVFLLYSRFGHKVETIGDSTYVVPSRGGSVGTCGTVATNSSSPCLRTRKIKLHISRPPVRSREADGDGPKHPRRAARHKLGPRAAFAEASAHQHQRRAEKPLRGG